MTLFPRTKLIGVASLIFLCACGHSTPLARKVLIESAGPLYSGPDGEVQLGGLSDLIFSGDEAEGDMLTFYSITDRGPNGKELGEGRDTQRPFLFPSFTPQILKISYSKATQRARLVATYPLINIDGSQVSGLPNVSPLVAKEHFDETPITVKGEILNFDPWGLDPEALAKDDKGFFWLGEEYGPSLLKVSPEGKILNRWYPATRNLKKLRGGVDNLPPFLAERKSNRGFEALVWTEKKTLLLFLQSGVPSQDKAEDFHNWVPILEFDPLSETAVGLYFYPLDPRGGKIGAATRTPDGFVVVLEQNGKTDKKAWQRIFTIDLKSADNLIAASLSADAKWKIPPATRPVKKAEFLNLSALGLSPFEKLEGLSVLPSGGVFIVNDNDFGLFETAEDEAAKSFLFEIKKGRSF